MLTDPALIVVDLQRDFCDPTFVPDDTDRSLVDPAIDATIDFLERYRESGRTPIFIATTHDEHSNSQLWTEKYENREKPMPCRPGTEGAALLPELGVRKKDIVLTKHRYSGFIGTSLDLHLSSNDVTEILVCGVNTNICIASTAYDAFNRDYKITVLEDCTGTTNPEQHKPILKNIDDHFGSVVQSDEVELPSVPADESRLNVNANLDEKLE